MPVHGARPRGSPGAGTLVPRMRRMRLRNARVVARDEDESEAGDGRADGTVGGATVAVNDQQAESRHGRLGRRSVVFRARPDAVTVGRCWHGYLATGSPLADRGRIGVEVSSGRSAFAWSPATEARVSGVPETRVTGAVVSRQTRGNSQAPRVRAAAARCANGEGSADRAAVHA